MWLPRAFGLCALSTCIGHFGCASSPAALYPSRPAAGAGAPIVEPLPARVVVHATISSAALKRALNERIPTTGEGTFPLLGSERRYHWERQPLELAFRNGRLAVSARVKAIVHLITDNELDLELAVQADPILNSDYQARLQSTTVDVTSSDRRLKIAQSLTGALDKIRDQIEWMLRDFRYDLQPLVREAHGRISRPIELPLGDAHGCARLEVLGVEAGPTVLADGIEKDLALVVSPSVTLPCATPGVSPTLPPLANVATLPSGPFTVQVPIAARYEELQRAMSLAFTNGRLYFSKDVPTVYLEKPEIYASRDQLVLKLHIAGRIAKYGIRTTLDGDLYMAGHPTVVDNEIRVPDLEPTIETSSFLLKLKAAIDRDSMRDQARQALRLDIGERLQSVRNRLSSELSFSSGVGPQLVASAEGNGCLRARVGRIEVTSVHAHAAYLRLYVSVVGQAAIYLPCPQNALSIATH
jgi:hypothetical protein